MKPRGRSLRDAGIVIATIMIVPVTIAVLWACGWYSSVPRASALEASAGVVQGDVSTVEADTATVNVSTSLFGFTTIPFTVTRDTAIVVGDKEGGFGDLYPGIPVRITYERREDSLVATCVQSLRYGDGVGRCPAPRPMASADAPGSR